MDNSENKYYFHIFDKDVENIFNKIIERNKTTVTKFINLSILLALAVADGLTKEEKKTLKKCVKHTQMMCK